MHTSVASLLAVAGAAQATCTFHWKASEGNTCSSMANDWNVPVQSFIRWNEGAVGAGCARGISPGSIYCVEWANEAMPSGAAAPDAADAPTNRDGQAAPPTVTYQPAPVQDGIAQDCGKWYRAQRGDTCQGIVDKFGGSLTVPDFEAWNPAVKPDCSALLATYYYCIAKRPTPPKQPSQQQPQQPIATPQPYFNDMTRSCDKFYRAAKGDTCDSIADKFQGLSVGDFQSWNPSVRPDCTGIIATYYYCVGSYGSRNPVSGTSTVSFLAAPSSSVSLSPSSQLQPSVALASAPASAPALASGASTPTPTPTPLKTTMATMKKGKPAASHLAGPSFPASSAAVAAVRGVPVPTQSGLTRECKEYYKVQEGDFCLKLTEKYNNSFTVDQL